MKRCVRGLLKEPLAVVFRRKPLGEPLRKAPCFPAIEVKDGPLRDILTYALPVERRLPANVQPREVALQQDKTRVQGGRIVGAAIDTSRQPLQPTRPNVVDG